MLTQLRKKAVPGTRFVVARFLLREVVSLSMLS
jgi:hypothetical protein